MLAQPDAQHHAEKLSVADRRALNVLADEKTGAFSGHKFHGKAVASLVKAFPDGAFVAGLGGEMVNQYPRATAAAQTMDNTDLPAIA